MKAYYFIIIYIVLIFSACSIGDVLKPSDQINISLMETVDTVKAVPGANISFKFMASTNFGVLTRIEISEKSHPFDLDLDSMKFTMVDQELGLSVDSSGFLSRAVSTLMAFCPLTVPVDEAYVGETLSVKFKVSDSQNNVASVRSCFRIVNLKNNDWLWLYVAFPDRASFYGYTSAGKHETYRSYYGQEKTIDIVVATDVNKQTFVLNPHAGTTEIFMNKMTYYKGYKGEPMRNTIFLKLNNADFEKIDDSFVERLDFSQATDQLEVKDKDIFAFQNQDGKKGVVHVRLQYNQLSLRSQIQIVAK